MDEKYLQELMEKYHLGGCRYNNMPGAYVQTQNRILQKYAKVPIFIACNTEAGGNGACSDGLYVGSGIKIGATENRLEYTMANLEETHLNLSEANSRIRDVDYAKMMMEYTKNQLLEQVATTILTHRMSNAQIILQLFN